MDMYKIKVLTENVQGVKIGTNFTISGLGADMRAFLKEIR